MAVFAMKDMESVQSPKTFRKQNIMDLLPESMGGRLWLRLHQERLKEGHYLFRQGEAGDTLYLVREGELAVFVATKDDGPTLLNLIWPGDIIGEACLLNPGRRNVDVVANKDSIVVKLPRKKMLDAMADNPALEAALRRKADMRHRVALLSANVILRIIPLEMRKSLAKETVMQHYQAKTTIHDAGDKPQYLDLLAAGKACYIWRDSTTTKVLESLHPGSLAGYASIIHNAGHSAELIAVKDTSMVRIPYAAFMNVVNAYPPLREALLVHAERKQKRFMRKLDELQTQQLS
jgi:CRP-like cAMP-binding protein